MISSKSYGLQNETRQYLRRLYAYGRELAPADVNDIDNFVKGLKQLNLWQNATIWMMRSIHNIGSGSNLLCFGGGPVLNMTLINSPTWSRDGLQCVRANDQYGRTAVTDVLDEFGVFSVATWDRALNCTFLCQDRWGGSFGNGSQYWQTFGTSSNQCQWIVGITEAGAAANNISSPLSGFVLHTCTKYRSLGSHSVNAGSASSFNSGLFLGSKRMVISFGRAGWGSGSALTGTMAVTARFNKPFKLDGSDYTNLNRLLRTTICKDILTT